MPKLLFIFITFANESIFCCDIEAFCMYFLIHKSGLKLLISFSVGALDVLCDGHNRT